MVEYDIELTASKMIIRDMNGKILKVTTRPNPFWQGTLDELRLYDGKEELKYQFIMLNAVTCECGSDNCNCHTSSGCETGSCESNFIEHVKSECNNAIHKAHKDALVQRMRKKLEDKHGTTLDKVADVTFEAFEKAWKSMKVQTKEKDELNVELEKIFSEKTE